ncbi:hypothetical protein N7491_004285 [Penicillium cf. griseofulvum]|uniref:Uncharacterized protein n=1 Tax=Penicillium cf. griseofulvum TaxID=2972120 RepID=A0A9W9J451_9EURO|nr:hypothetical protein N7472_006979 [Penicillium cf. griseofulvum]KAJ5433690.1 hypothetical protein N7491_004285 [Penicillium cf. griseofulvum]
MPENEMEFNGRRLCLHLPIAEAQHVYCSYEVLLNRGNRPALVLIMLYWIHLQKADCFHDAQFFSGEHAEFWSNATAQKKSTRGLRVMPRP